MNIFFYLIASLILSIILRRFLTVISILKKKVNISNGNNNCWFWIVNEKGHFECEDVSGDDGISSFIKFTYFLPFFNIFFFIMCIFAYIYWGTNYIFSKNIAISIFGIKFSNIKILFNKFIKKK